MQRPAEPGKPTRETARASFDSLEAAVSGALAGQYAAVVARPGFEEIPSRGPLSTFRARLSSSLTARNTPNHAHVPHGRQAYRRPRYRPRAARRGRDHVSRATRSYVGTLLAASSRFAEASPRRALPSPGLNPHAGEQARHRPRGDRNHFSRLRAPPCCSLATAPTSATRSRPDTVFMRSVSGEFDGVLCTYHDQGLIPLKLHAFDEGVNVTLGLPFPRTSPDHGTAFDIAGKGIARPDSMIAAIRLACELRTRDSRNDPTASFSFAFRGRALVAIPPSARNARMFRASVLPATDLGERAIRRFPRHRV